MKSIIFKWINFIAKFFVIFGFLVVILPLIYDFVRPTVTLQKPITLSKGIILSEEFRPLYSGYYEVELEADTPYDKDFWGPWDPEISWTVSDVNSIIETNRSQPMKSVSHTGKGKRNFRFGGFNAKVGKKYKIEVSRNPDAKAEKLPDTRLTVFKYTSVDSAIILNVIMTLGFFMFLGGGIILVTTFVFRKFTSRTEA